MTGHSISFESAVYIGGHYSAAAGEREFASEYSRYFDMAATDDTMGEKSYEKSEQALYKAAALGAVNSAGLVREQTDVLLGGDLLNQIISSGFTARELGIPFLGLYGACSSMAEGLTIGAMMVDGGYVKNALCATSSHFATAERQFRQPLEMGTPKTPTSQITVSAAGACLLSKNDYRGEKIRVKSATIGCVCDLGITDANNMGAAMAPACCDTLLTHFKDNAREPSYYDMIVTGDLGTFGTQVLHEMLAKGGVDIKKEHFDCGVNIFKGQKETVCGASGCGCCASMLCGYIIKSIIAGGLSRVLFTATGAMLSRTSTLQGESIPCIAHCVELVREKN